jgi:hypothetical protein
VQSPWFERLAVAVDVRRERPNWRDDALCAEREYGYLPWVSDPAPHELVAMKEVCGRCLVKDECRAWADSQPEGDVVGMWGGMLFGRTVERCPKPTSCGSCGRAAPKLPAGYCTACYHRHRRRRVKERA